MFFLIIDFNNLIITSNFYLPKKLFAFLQSSFLDEKMRCYIFGYVIYTIKIIMIYSIYFYIFFIKMLSSFKLWFYVAV